MPLFKRKPFGLAEPPKDLEPYALVYQVRFTKEIFQDYQEYLNRINFYRQRVWMCKYTGKSNMTYEEALVSEKHATQKVQELPNELVAPALCIIQFSMLSLRDLADAIAKKLQKDLFVGANLYGRKDGSLYPCKVLKLVENGVEKIQYEVAWINKTRKITENSIVLGEDLVWKKTPFSRNILKSFIRESTCRSIPWVIHEKLAQKHGISTDPPQELRSRFFFKDGQLVAKMKKRKNGDGKNEVNDESGKSKRKKVETGTSDAVKNGKEENNQPKEEPVKYPIDDLLVQPGPDDPLFTDRPFPSRDFNVPMDCVGDLLMVWDFCSSFSRLLHLWPFSLEDFENAICHKDSNLVLIAETHSALLRLLIKDDSEYSFALQKRKRKPKISLITWTDYVCDFLEMINITELSSSMTTIKRGHYGLLDANAKLWVLRELVSHALETDLIRGKLDEHIEQRQMLGAIRRGEALEYARKRREEKEQLKGESGADGLVKENSLESTGSNPHIAENGNPIIETGDMVEEVISSQQSNTFYDRRQLDCPSMKTEEKQNVDPKVLAENVTNSCEKEAQKQLSGDKKEAEERKSKEKRQQRREYFEREMEKRSIRTSPLGKDRDYNRYWWFRRDGRIFIEISDTKQWGYYSTKEEVDALIRSLNRKGERERALQIQLEKFYGKICLELQKRSKDLAHKIALEEAVLRRSTRVRAPPRENPANAFLRYVNKWKED
ncbi:DDT domain-containing protein DDB_G0282237 isoform X2 [Herrania umbratica]|uniref:DDT domain-containing protein DDB_G0282237 isoform X2 n=1 Tax=Herrania umbratica TaxID=108875 RepID=A0A6J0ZGI5_9ROSI|nr:DDT domain-containing protein DDB_G0282237 isoform X2 [Herrania umbratica]